MQKKKKDACLTVKFEWNYFSGGGQREIISNERNGSLCVDINFISCQTSECVCVKVNFKFWFYSNSWLANLNSLSNGNNMDEYKWFLQKDSWAGDTDGQARSWNLSYEKSHGTRIKAASIYSSHVIFGERNVFFPQNIFKVLLLVVVVVGRGSYSPKGISPQLRWRIYETMQMCETGNIKKTARKAKPKETE